MGTRSPARSLRRRLREVVLAAVLLVAEAGLLALAGSSWWAPALLLSVIPLFVLGRATLLGGVLDPVLLRRGIQGEQKVADVLALLEPHGFRVLHDLDIGRGNADHVVVGPTGLFVIETKDWGGRFYPRGGRLMFNQRPAAEVVSQVRAAALAVRRRLEIAGVDVQVHPVIASTRAKVYRSPLRMGYVTVLEVEHLPAFVTRQDPSLDDDTVSAAVTAILQPDALAAGGPPAPPSRRRDAQRRLSAGRYPQSGVDRE
jgi:hypothetical protein